MPEEENFPSTLVDRYPRPVLAGAVASELLQRLQLLTSNNELN